MKSTGCLLVEQLKERRWSDERWSERHIIDSDGDTNINIPVQRADFPKQPLSRRWKSPSDPLSWCDRRSAPRWSTFPCAKWRLPIRKLSKIALKIISYIQKFNLVISPVKKKSKFGQILTLNTQKKNQLLANFDLKRPIFWPLKILDN